MIRDDSARSAGPRSARRDCPTTKVTTGARGVSFQLGGRGPASPAGEKCQLVAVGPFVGRNLTRLAAAVGNRGMPATGGSRPLRPGRAGFSCRRWVSSPLHLVVLRHIAGLRSAARHARTAGGTARALRNRSIIGVALPALREPYIPSFQLSNGGCGNLSGLPAARKEVAALSRLAPGPGDQLAAFELGVRRVEPLGVPAIPQRQVPRRRPQQGRGTAGTAPRRRSTARACLTTLATSTGALAAGFCSQPPIGTGVSSIRAIIARDRRTDVAQRLPRRVPPRHAAKDYTRSSSAAPGDARAVDTVHRQLTAMYPASGGTRRGRRCATSSPTISPR